MTPLKETPAHLPAPPSDSDGFTLISNEKLLALYAAMLKCRILERRTSVTAGGKQPAAPGDAGGQEASAVGVAIDLLPGDTVIPCPGDVCPGFVKGASLKAILSAAGSGKTPAERWEAAAGVARLNKRAKNGKMVVLFLGCEAGAPGVREKWLRTAAARGLPILFVSRACGEESLEEGQDCGLPKIAVDGEDVVAVYRVASESIAHARRGNGPTLIECRTWVLEGAGKKKQRGAGGAVRNMEKYLTAKRLFSRKFKAEVELGFERKLEEAVKAAGAGRRSSRALSK